MNGVWDVMMKGQKPLGKGVIVHQGVDDFITQPTGDAEEE